MSKYRLRMASILVQQFLRMLTKIKKFFGGLSPVTDYNQSFSAFWRKSSQSEKVKLSRMGRQSVQVSVWTLDMLEKNAKIWCQTIIFLSLNDIKQNRET